MLYRITAPTIISVFPKINKSTYYTSAGAGRRCSCPCLHYDADLPLRWRGLRPTVARELARHVVGGEPGVTLTAGPRMPGGKCVFALLPVLQRDLARLVVLTERADRLTHVAEAGQLLSIGCRYWPGRRREGLEHFFTSTLCTPPLRRVFRAGASAARSGDRDGHRNGQPCLKELFD